MTRKDALDYYIEWRKHHWNKFNFKQPPCACWDIDALIARLAGELP